MVNQICSVIFGGCGIIANATIYQQKKRQKILWFKLVSNILWSAHYLFLFAYAGMGVCLIGVVRESIFINKDKKWAKSKIWLVIFLFLK